MAATGINENNANTFQLTVSPSLTGQTVKVTYSLKENAAVVLEVRNTAGQSVIKKDLGKQGAGDYTSDFDLSTAAAGVYFIRFSADKKSQTAKFTLAH